MWLKESTGRKVVLRLYCWFPGSLLCSPLHPPFPRELTVFPPKALDALAPWERVRQTNGEKRCGLYVDSARQN